MRERHETRRRWLWLIPLVLIAGYLLQMVGLAHSPCVLKTIVGLPCPTCGSTRAAMLLFKGRIREALAMHPLIFLSLILILLTALSLGRLYAGLPTLLDRASERGRRLLRILLLAIAALYGIVYVVRMVRLFPHTEPMTFNGHSVVGLILRLFR